MSDRESFLRAIRANPADDTVRLVFADWLDERGDPLGEFVRLQLELDPVRDQLDNPRVRELRDREKALLDAHRREWLGPAADLADEPPAFGPVFRRGLPEMVCLPLDTFLKRGGELFAACPTVREVSLFGLTDRSAALAACPHLRHVETLELAEVMYTDFPDGVAALCDAIRTAHVRTLRVPALFDPHLIHMLGGGIATGWPRWVEFVQHTPLDTNCREYAAALDRIAGRSVSRIVRPFEARFPLLGDLGHGLFAGHSRGRPILAAARNHPGTGSAVLTVAGFDAGGWLVREASYPLPGGVNSAREYLARNLGYEPGLIHVRQFRTSQNLCLAAHLWSLVDESLMPVPAARRHRWWTPPAWRNRGGVLRRWLHEGRFVVAVDGREFWGNFSGTLNPA